MKTRLLLILILFSYSFGISQEENALTLISWNIEHFGRTKNMAELERIADLVQHADILTIQEVVINPVGERKVKKLAEILSSRGSKWTSVVSDTTNDPKPKVKKRYAVLWKPSRVRSKGEGQLIKELDKHIGREPFEMHFVFNNKTVTLLSFHARPNGSGAEKENHVLASYVTDSYNSPIVIAGDFNLKPNSDQLKQLEWLGYRSVLNNKKTTLKDSCQDSSDYLASSLDQFYFSKHIKYIDGKVIDYIETCENFEEASKISNHLPISFVFEIR